MATWNCVQHCGACCYLDPHERPGLEEYLTPEELQQYLEMVGEDGWCVNFDPTTRECRIYNDRPRFCRVHPENFQQMYGIDANEFDEFAIDCCHQHIESMYGADSLEMQRYRHQIRLTSPRTEVM